MTRVARLVLVGRKRLALVVAIAVMLVTSVGVIAFWTGDATPGSYGAANAGTLPAGNTPTVSLATRNITVSWAQNTFLGGPLGTNANGGYLVQRYAVSDLSTPITPGSACAGTRTGASDPLSCIEASVATGRWKYAVTPTYYGWLGAQSTKSATVTIAPNAPTSVTLTNGGGAGNAYVNGANVTSLSFDVALPATSLGSDTVALTLSDGSTSFTTSSLGGTAGAGTVSFTGVDASSLADGPITITAKATSSYGDDSPTTPLARTKDTVAPVNSFTLRSQSPDDSTLLTGATVFYRGTGGGAGGSFKLRNTPTDTGGTGPASTSYAALAGTTTGWSFTANTDTSSPYDSNTFTWAEGTSSSPTETPTAADTAGNTAGTTLTYVNDSVAPTGGSITANGAAVYNTTGVVPLTKVDFVEAASATQSGLATNVITRASASLSGNSCGSFSGSSTVTVAGGNDSSTLANGCYRYTLTGTDNVGNTATAVSTDVKVDKTAPTAPTFTFASVVASAYYSGSGTQVFFRPAAASGSFQITASSTDGETAVASYTFPASLGSGWTTSGAGATRTYSYVTGAAQPGAQNATATNNAGLTSGNGVFTVTADSTAPTGGSVTANGSGSASYNTTGSISISKVNFAESASATQSGLASGTNVVTRATASLVGDVCGGFSGAVVVPGSTDSGLGVGCYQYTLTGTDNVGNTATALSAIVKVDTSAPTAPSLTFSSVNPSVYYSGSGTNVFFRSASGASGSFNLTASSTEPDTAVASYTFPSLGSGWTTSGSGATRTYSYSGSAATPGTRNVTATNTAGLTSGNGSFSVTNDTTAPTGGSLTPTSTVNASGTTSYSKTGTFGVTRVDYSETASGTASGLATSALQRTTATYTNSTGACGAFGSATTVVGSASESTLPEGCYRYTLTGTDNVGNTVTTTVTVIVDKTAPTATNVQLTNGGTQGRADRDDTVVITFAEVMDASGFCSTWVNDGSDEKLDANNLVTVTINNVGASDTLTVSTASGCTFNLGTVNLNADYVNANTTFTGSGSNKSELIWDPTTKQLTIILGTGTGSATGVANSTPSYSPNVANIKDLAGNAIGAGPFTGTSSRF